MDPLNVVGRSHDLTLWSRVVGYEPEDLSALLYEDREFFDYGGNLRVYPMNELPFWRMVMSRRAQEPRRADYARQNSALLIELRAELQARGPLGNRAFTGRSPVVSYRGRKDSAVGLYHLWITGEVMVHHRVGFERVYDLCERVAPASADHIATVEEADDFFALKALAYLGWGNARSWTRTMSFFTGRRIERAEARRRLDDMVASGEALEIGVEGEKEPCYLPASDAELLEAVQTDRVPDAWRPLAATTLEEVVFLAPLDTVVARGRAQALFDFEYLWEVYKPVAQRRWGYYTLPILYGDRLVARLDPWFERASGTLIVRGFWLEDKSLGDERQGDERQGDKRLADDADFADALARGLRRLAEFVKAVHVDAAAVEPARLRRHIEARVH